MKRLVFSLSIPLLLLGVLFNLAFSQVPSANAILGRIDSVLSAPEDMEAHEVMTLIENGGRRTTREVRIRQKGSDLRLVQFLSPADVRGVGFLRRSENQLYLYLPAFRKVRRIASSATREDFVGTDFTYEDLAQRTYADDYEPTDLHLDGGQYVLDLTPRPDADVSYDRLTLRADTGNFVLRQVDYFSGERPVKRMTVDNIVQVDGYWIGKRMEMTDRRSGHRTVLELSEINFDQGLSESLFSERYLRRPVR